MKTIKTNKKVINQYGDLVKAVIIAPKSSAIFHETIDGKWVLKVIAIREGLTLTGLRERMETAPQYSLVPA